MNVLASGKENAGSIGKAPIAGKEANGNAHARQTLGRNEDQRTQGAAETLKKGPRGGKSKPSRKGAITATTGMGKYKTGEGKKVLQDPMRLRGVTLGGTLGRSDVRERASGGRKKGTVGFQKG